MDAGALRRKDTTKGPPLRILSLDGGGVRGYSMFIIIQELMHRTFVETEGRAPRRNEIPKPADHFDLIVGTGTGGLIALMLGRLRLDLETCKELYVQMTRMVFETDKTVFGIPTRPTLFKASRLEEAIKEAVYQHTVTETEGNDGTDIAPPSTPLSPTVRQSLGHVRRNLSNASTVSFSERSPAAQMARPAFMFRTGGDRNARLYDSRENRTKTAVTAIYKGTPKGGEPAMLRSYDSRREPSPEFDCKIWEAGRATCAIGLAFKPIQIGQSVFHDDGAGTFNPSIQALDEAAVNEWPGREVGVFLSVGTGKRQKDNNQNSHVWYEDFMGEFAEARKRLLAKIEGCEDIHEYMKKEHLVKRGVNIDNYYRLNVEVGVGEFGMNEWNRLADISTGTRRYLSREAERRMIESAAVKLAKIHRAKQRYDRAPLIPELKQSFVDMPFAVELPGDMPMTPVSNKPPSRQSYDSGPDTLQRPATGSTTPRSSNEAFQPPPATNTAAVRPQSALVAPTSHRQSNPATTTSLSLGSPGSPGSPGSEDGDKFVVTAPTPAQYRHAAGSDKISITGPEEQSRRPAPSRPAPPPMSGAGSGPVQPPAPLQPHRIEPPPLPPKTPLPDVSVARRPPVAAGAPIPPYPIDDEPPPVVNKARKPDYRGR